MEKMKNLDFENEVFQTLSNLDENAYSIYKLYSMMNSSHHWICKRKEIQDRVRIFEVNLFTNNIKLNHINFYSSELVNDIHYVPIDFEYDFNIGMERSFVVKLLFPINGTEFGKILKYVASKAFECSDNIGFDFRLMLEEIENFNVYNDWLNKEDSIVKEGWFDNLIISGGLENWDSILDIKH